MKTWDECCKEVAQRHNLGDQLVTGHKSAYYREAAMLFGQSIVEECAEVAVVKIQPNGWYEEYRVDRESIRKVKEQIK